MSWVYWAMWWSHLRATYSKPDQTQKNFWNEEQRCINTIFHPEITDTAIIDACPAHMHLNLLERAQGKGIGSHLCSLCLDGLRQSGVKGVHVGTSATNVRVTHFWKKCGFTDIGKQLKLSDGETIWLGQKL